MIKTGIDILEVSRIKKLYENKSQLSQVFTENEIKYCERFNNPFPHFAGFYSAKEAFLKALEVGVRNGLDFLDIEISHKDNGAPYYILRNVAKTFVENYGFKDIILSISHTENLATAICIME